MTFWSDTFWFFFTQRRLAILQRINFALRIFRCVSCSRPFPLPPCLSLSLHVASCLDTYFGVVCCPPWTVPPSIHPSLLSIHPLTYGLFFIDVVPIHLSTCSCFVPSFNTSPSCWCRTHEIVSLSSSPCRKKPETVQFVVRVCARCPCCSRGGVET